METIVKERIQSELPVYSYIAPLDKACRIQSLRQVGPQPSQPSVTIVCL